MHNAPPWGVGGGDAGGLRLVAAAAGRAGRRRSPPSSRARSAGAASALGGRGPVIHERGCGRSSDPQWRVRSIKPLPTASTSAEHGARAPRAGSTTRPPRCWSAGWLEGVSRGAERSHTVNLTMLDGAGADIGLRSRAFAHDAHTLYTTCCFVNEQNKPKAIRPRQIAKPCDARPCSRAGPSTGNVDGGRAPGCPRAPLVVWTTRSGNADV